MLNIISAQRGRVAGRQPGRDYSTRDLRSMVLAALERAGGVKYLAERAIDTPGPFLALLGKVLPTTLASTDGSPIGMQLLAAQLVSAEIIQQRSAPPTIQHEPEHTVDLLDQPPPLE